MIINFRQGIVSYPSTNGVQKFLQASGNNVTLNAANGVIDITLAHRSTNYLHTESVTVPNAWSALPTNSIVWLYWDFNTLTGERTFGYTDLEPISQNSAPANPDIDQHWFDTASMYMRVWNGNRWQEIIRVFAAEYDTGASTFLSVSAYSTSQRFDGTQIGIQGDYTAGRILTDNTGRAIRSQMGEFFTTEDEFFINGSPITAIRLESNVLQAVCSQAVAKNQVVAFVDFDTVEPASYNNLQVASIALCVADAPRGDVGSFIVQGVVTDPSWNWTAVGQQLWVSEGGTLVATDPHITDPLTYPIAKAPVARVIGRHSVFFDQGLGGKGEKGDAATPSNSGEAATQFELGKVKLTVAPADPGSPYAVETSDPRMSDARVPLQHTHPASDVVPSSFGANINGTLQRSLENLESAKLNKNGDTLAGDLLIPTVSNNSNAAVPKHYVDTFIPLAQKGAALGVATLDAAGRLNASQLPQITVTDTFVVSSEADMLAVPAQTGDTVVRTDISATFILRGSNPTVLGDWQELLTRPDGVTWINVTSSAAEGLLASGGPVTSSGTITLSLANDLAAIESLQGTGVAHRVGTDSWELKAVDLGAGPGVVSGVLPMANGGTGLASVTGYLKGNGTAFTASTTIPGADVTGTVPAASSAPWAGVTGKPTTLAGYGITDAYTKAETNALTWNWSAITNKPTTLVGYGISDVYSKTEVNTFLSMKANVATTLAGYGITDASPSTHNHALDSLSNVNTTTKAAGEVLSWSGSQWVNLSISNSVLPSTISNKTIDNTNTISVLDTNFTVENSAASTRRFRFNAGSISSGTTRILTVPDSNGTIALTNGFGATGSWNITAASASAAPWSGITGRPTTLAGYGITDAYTQAQTSALTWNWSAISGTPTSLSGYGITNAYTKTEVDSKTWNWSSITNRPATLSGYGIGDAYTRSEVDSKTWNWSAITSRPTTLAGYGITDAAPIVHNHDGVYLKPSDIGATVAGLDIAGKLSPSQIPDGVYGRVYTVASEAEQLALSATRGDIAVRTDQSMTYVLRTNASTAISDWTQLVFPQGGNGTVTSIDMIQPAAGITVTGGPIASSGAFTVALANDLAAIEGLTSTGYAKRVAADTWSVSATVPAADISGTVSITNGGTGASSASQALTNLGAPSVTGVGASGTWSINISGNAQTATNASTVTNGVYTTGTYADPSWIVSLDPNKVVGSWLGSSNISQVSGTVDFGAASTIRNGSITTTTTASTLLDAFDTAIYGSGKYTVQVKTTGQVMLVELFIAVDDAGNVFINQFGTNGGIEPATFTAVLNGTTSNVEVYASAASAASTRYVFSALLMRDL